MLRKTSASLGLVIAATLGAPLTCSPAYAHANLLRGWHSHYYSSHHSHNRNRNANRHRARIFIRIYVYNKNNNHAQALVARPERRRERPAFVVRDADPFAGTLGGGTLGGSGATGAAQRVPAVDRGAIGTSVPAVDQGAIGTSVPTG